MDSVQFLSAARLAIVAGKGGVGKTTVTAVMARAAFDAGLRVLVVELEGKSALAELFVDTPIDVLAITAAEALAEYLATHGLKRLSKRLSTSGIIDVVATAAPGIDDILVLGKLKQLERGGMYDLIVVDGPAAGHAISFLLSARSLINTVRSGPIRTQADDVLEMFADPTRCQVFLVTLPETTPVNEVIETAYSLEEAVGVQLGTIIVNGIDQGAALPDPDLAEPPPLPPAIRLAAQFRNRRRTNQRDECARLTAELALPQILLPQLAVAGIQANDLYPLAVALVQAIEGLG